MNDLQKTVEGYKVLYQFLINFNNANSLKKIVILRQLEEKIKLLEAKLESEENGNG